MSTTAVVTTNPSPPPPPALDLTQACKVIEAALAKVGADPRAICEEGVLQALRGIRTIAPGRYATYRSQAKQHNKAVSLTELDRLTDPDEDPKAKPLDRLIAIASSMCILAHDADRRGVAIVERESHREVWFVRGNGFLNWLRAEYFRIYRTGVPKTALTAAVTTIEAIGVNVGEEVEVHVRCAKVGDSYVLDMCDDLWHVIQVDKSGVTVLDRSPALFTRSEQMRALPLPGKSADLDRLWQHANVPPEQRPLVLAWLLDSMRPETPFPVLEITGEQGSAKSSTQRALRALVDPNKVLLRGAPKSVQDIYIAAANNWVVSYENLSELTEDEQDALCTLATGGGFAARRLYTDGDEHLMKTKRPVMLNGISGVASRPDLIERTVRVDSPSIDTAKRRTDADMEAAWETDYPVIFTGLLDLFAKALAKLDQVKLAQHQRMADYERLGEALLRSEGKTPGTFSTLYAKAVQEGTERALENYGIAQALVRLLEEGATKGRTSWSGTIGELLKVLGNHGKEDRGNWPKSPRGLSDQLKRITTSIRGLGIEITEGVKIKRGRLVTVSLRNDAAPSPSGVAKSSNAAPKPNAVVKGAKKKTAKKESKSAGHKKK